MYTIRKTLPTFVIAVVLTNNNITVRYYIAVNLMQNVN